MIRVLLAATAPPPQTPRPDDMTELARLVAKELRKRGIVAGAWSEIATATIRYPGINSTGRLCWQYETVTRVEFAGMNASEIANVIQAEEAKKAAEWAGDE